MSDPVHDEAAYAALRVEAYAMQRELRRIERERELERMRLQLAAEEEAKRIRREELNAKYPSTVSAEIYEIADQLAYNRHDDYTDPREIAEEYGHLVGIIDKALSSARAEYARAMLSRTQLQ